MMPCDSKCSDWDTYSESPQTSDKLFQIQEYGVATTSEDSFSDWNLLKTWIMIYGPRSVDIVVDSCGSYGSSDHDPNDFYENDDSGITDQLVDKPIYVKNPSRVGTFYG